jgi:peptidoglycan/LPS O-acetylase OafA/YrhL
MSNTRFHTLDSLRGVAALQVVIAHCLVAVPSLSWLVFEGDNKKGFGWGLLFNHSPLSILWSDSAAVKVFFVLSGFVLSLPYFQIENKEPYYPRFFVKRIVRLYLPCLAVLLLSLLLKEIVYNPGNVSDFGQWVKIMWNIRMTPGMWVDLFTLRNNLNFFDRALWTLAPEIKLSLILPLAIYVHRKMNVIGSIFFVLAYIAIWHTLNKSGIRTWWSDFPTLYYFTFFLIGSIICKYRNAVINWINTIPNIWYFVFVAVTIIIYTFAHSMWWIPKGLYQPLRARIDYVSAFSAVGTLVIALSERAKGFFNSKLLLFLGKVSFSIYLIHIVVVAAMANIFGKMLSPELTVGLAFILSFPLALLFYNCVEVPSIKLANILGSLIRKKKTLLQAT